MSADATDFGTEASKGSKEEERVAEICASCDETERL